MNPRVKYKKVPGSEQVFNPDFVEYLIALHDEFSGRVAQLRLNRVKKLEHVHRKGYSVLSEPVTHINTGNWTIDPIPDELRTPGIEISGPASITPMFINAINPDKDGFMADGYLDDDEDAGGHTLKDTVLATINRRDAVLGTLDFYDPDRGKNYSVAPGTLPFFMHRERRLHLDEFDLQIDDHPVSATILGTALTLFHVGKAQFSKSQAVYFYLPKIEDVEEAKFYRDFFDFTRKSLGLKETDVIKAIILIESLPAVYQMEELLYALGPYAAGLNAARWDLKASILEFLLPDPKFVWPDRFEVDIKSTDFISNIFKRLVAICLNRNAVPIGGMATALPSRDPEINKIAASAIQKDKKWEADNGFIRGWSAHVYHMRTAAETFKKLGQQKPNLSQSKSDPTIFPIKIEVPSGAITEECTRRNIRTIIEYCEGWLSGRGAKGINSMEGKPGKNPALMEDLATARISVAQTAQRVIHSVLSEDTGRNHNLQIVRSIAEHELANILDIRRLDHNSFSAKMENRYSLALEITNIWIENYTQLRFNSLGSYTREYWEHI